MAKRDILKIVCQNNNVVYDGHFAKRRIGIWKGECHDRSVVMSILQKKMSMSYES